MPSRRYDTLRYFTIDSALFSAGAGRERGLALARGSCGCVVIGLLRALVRLLFAAAAARQLARVPGLHGRAMLGIRAYGIS